MSAQIASACILCGCAGSGVSSQPARIAQEPAPPELRQAQSLLDDARRALAAQRRSDAANSSEQALLALKRGRVVSHADLIIIAYTYVDVARVLMQASRAATAREALLDAVSLLKPGSKPEDAGIIHAEQTLGELSLQEWDPVTALAAFSTASATAARHEWVSREIAALRGVANAQNQLHRPADVRSTWERAVYLDEHFPDRDSPRYDAILSLVTAYASAGDPRADQLFARYHGFQRVMDVATATFSYRTQSFDRPKPAPPSALAPLAPAPPAPAPAPVLGTLPTEPLTPPTVSDPARLEAGMRAGFQACMQASFARSAGQHGVVRLLVTVNNGGAASLVSSLTLGLPVTLTDCLLARVSAAIFAPPEGGSAVNLVPMTFVVYLPP
jgi:hypothetical protein